MDPKPDPYPVRVVEAPEGVLTVVLGSLSDVELLRLSVRRPPKRAR